MSNQTLTPLLHKFLAIDRFKAFGLALTQSNQLKVEGKIDDRGALIALLIGVMPGLSVLLQSRYPSIDVTMFFTGCAAILAIVFRIKCNIQFKSVSNWKESLSLTHTAFALGCIPVAIVVALHPQALYVVGSNSQVVGPSISPSIFSLVLIIAQIGIWAGLTEEFIYRGLLVSVLRRWKRVSNSHYRNWIAVCLSALVFSFAHIPSWGPLMSLALFPVGIGFGLAYLAIGELILPLVVYHALFDVLSLSAAILLHKV